MSSPFPGSRRFFPLSRSALTLFLAPWYKAGACPAQLSRGPHVPTSNQHAASSRGPDLFPLWPALVRGLSPAFVRRPGGHHLHRPLCRGPGPGSHQYRQPGLQHLFRHGRHALRGRYGPQRPPCGAWRLAGRFGGLWPHHAAHPAGRSDAGPALPAVPAAAADTAGSGGRCHAARTSVPDHHPVLQPRAARLLRPFAVRPGGPASHPGFSGAHPERRRQYRPGLPVHRSSRLGRAGGGPGHRPGLQLHPVPVPVPLPVPSRPAAPDPEGLRLERDPPWAASSCSSTI